MRPRGRGGLNSLGLGLLLLGYRVLQTGLDIIPPVTLALVGLQSLLFVGILSPPWSATGVCLSAFHVLQSGDYRRLILAALEHASDMHLYFNMSSLLMKGKTLEIKYGSRKFLLLMLWLIFSTSLCYVGLMEAAALFIHPSFRDPCAIGFSGVLFAMKVLTTYYTSQGFDSRSTSWFLGLHVSVPTRYAVWIELLIIHILVPRSSFVGHLSGILVGLAFVTTKCEQSLDMFDKAITTYWNYISDWSYTNSSERRLWEDEVEQFDATDPALRLRYNEPQDQYRSYNREDFTPSRNLEPIFGVQTSRRNQQNYMGFRPSYTYSSGRPTTENHRPRMSPDINEEPEELTPEQVRQQRLRRFIRP